MSLQVITALSRRYGADSAYVLAGGGNTSFKDEKYLYVKPSGVPLRSIQPEDFVKMERETIRACFSLGDFASVAEREAEVKRRMAYAVAVGSSGRPSVEAPLHELMPFRYVVHLHPALINALTCGAEGAMWAGRLFPEALWVDYVDPGFTLAQRVSDALQGFVRATNRAPAVILLQNHGVFVGGDTPEAIDAHYSHLMGTLRKHVDVTLAQGTLDTAWVADTAVALRAPLGAGALRSAAPFRTARGPLTPDHIVYAKSYSLISEDPTPEAIDAFARRHGYRPLVLDVPGRAVFGAGANGDGAATVLELARDAALVEVCAAAFGGAHYLTDAQRGFIENWEVESYRKSVAAGGASDRPLKGKVCRLSPHLADLETPLRKAGADVVSEETPLEEILLAFGGLDIVLTDRMDTLQESMRVMERGSAWGDIVLFNVLPAELHAAAQRGLAHKVKVNGIETACPVENPMGVVPSLEMLLLAVCYFVGQSLETGKTLSVSGGVNLQK